MRKAKHRCRAFALLKARHARRSDDPWESYLVFRNSSPAEFYHTQAFLIEPLYAVVAHCPSCQRYFLTTALWGGCHHCQAPLAPDAPLSLLATQRGALFLVSVHEEGKQMQPLHTWLAAPLRATLPASPAATTDPSVVEKMLATEQTLPVTPRPSTQAGPSRSSKQGRKGRKAPAARTSAYGKVLLQAGLETRLLTTVEQFLGSQRIGLPRDLATFRSHVQYDLGPELCTWLDLRYHLSETRVPAATLRARWSPTLSRSLQAYLEASLPGGVLGHILPAERDYGGWMYQLVLPSIAELHSSSSSAQRGESWYPLAVPPWELGRWLLLALTQALGPEGRKLLGITPSEERPD